jgi:hypothetical protein
LVVISHSTQTWSPAPSLWLSTMKAEAAQALPHVEGATQVPAVVYTE